ALVQVLVRSTPGVVDAHRVVGRDRTVDERPAGAASVLLDELLERPRLLPESENLALECWKVYGARYWLIHEATILRPRVRTGRSGRRAGHRATDAQGTARREIVSGAETGRQYETTRVGGRLILSRDVGADCESVRQREILGCVDVEERAE